MCFTKFLMKFELFTSFFIEIFNFFHWYLYFLVQYLVHSENSNNQHFRNAESHFLYFRDCALRCDICVSFLSFYCSILKVKYINNLHSPKAKMTKKIRIGGNFLFKY